MHDFIHKYCFLIYYPIWNIIHFNSENSSIDGVWLAYLKLTLLLVSEI